MVCATVSPDHQTKSCTGRRPVTLKVPPHELAECLLTVQPFRTWHPLVEQRVRELFALPWPAADHEVELCLHHQEGQPQAVNRDPSACQGRAERGAGEVPAVAQRGLEHTTAAREGALVEAHVAMVRRALTLDARPRQLLHPADVLRRHEVPRRSQDVRPHDRAIVERTVDSRVGKSL